ncbi:MAG: UvrD-helicase domain-containing protein [Galactobacter sp.]|uniref:UvrD-helicase domain-containing protein n=1 Tax=Galactobacter sp. TaxID=2676125 RepID=UPI0025B8A4B4|nr:UvrD-helicase domain-containing protein [Galactobacter sp.]
MRSSITLSNRFADVDGSLSAKIYRFLAKVQENDAAPGLHIEPMKNAADRRARTGRVDDKHRAVLFLLDTKEGRHYLYVGTFGHDDAIDKARRLKAQYNPAVGVTDVVDVQPEPWAPVPGRVAPSAGESTLPNAQSDGGQEGGAAPATETSNPFAALGEAGAQAALGLGVNPSVVRTAQVQPSEAAWLDYLATVPTWQGLVITELAVGNTPEYIAQELQLGGSDTDESVVHGNASVSSAATSTGLDDPTADSRSTSTAGAPEAPGCTEATDVGGPGTGASGTVSGDDATDDQLLAGLRHPAAAMEFAYIGEDADALREIIESGDFQQWRTFLHPQQRKFVEKRFNGPARISGGAGTGKTVVVVHRAVALTRADDSSRVIATTFTKALAAQLQGQIRALDSSVPLAASLGSAGLYVRGLDQLAAEVLTGRFTPGVSGLGERAMETVFGSPRHVPGSILTDAKDLAQWNLALDMASRSVVLDRTVLTPEFMRDEYLAVVLPQRVRTSADYLRAPRRGRGVALNRGKRAAVWKVIEEYRAESAAENVLTFAERTFVAAALLDEAFDAGGVRPADHVLVDEGQDLHEGHWLMLRALVAPGPDDLFISEDSQQRIYGRHVVLSRVGIRIVGRSRRLTLNYRTTKQNLDAAVSVLQGSTTLDVEDQVIDGSGYTSVRSGPEPVVLSPTDAEDEYRLIAEELLKWQDASTESDPHLLNDAAVLVFANYQVQQVIEGLKRHGVEATQAGDAASNSKSSGDSVQVLTMNRSKGLEFRVVALSGIGEGSPFRDLRKFQKGPDREEEAARRRALLYVAMTRARDLLMNIQ